MQLNIVSIEIDILFDSHGGSIRRIQGLEVQKSEKQQVQILIKSLT